MQTTALAPWFGAKRTMAAEIVRHIGPHRVYWEPFCGSMAVVLAKPPATMETVNDLHGDLVNLARVIQDESLSARLYWRLRRTLAAEDLFRGAVATVKSGPAPGVGDEPSVDRAYAYFVASWLGMNGIAGTNKPGSSFCKRFSGTGGAPATRFLSAVESLPDWHERLRPVAILSGCGIDLCERVADEDGAVIYVDPPYLKKGAKYLHDFTPADHERLAAALRRFARTRVVLSYYDEPRLWDLYDGWEVVRPSVAKKMTAGGRQGDGRTDAPEVLLMNWKADAANASPAPTATANPE